MARDFQVYELDCADPEDAKWVPAYDAEDAAKTYAEFSDYRGDYQEIRILMVREGLEGEEGEQIENENGEWQKFETTSEPSLIYYARPIA